MNVTVYPDRAEGVAKAPPCSDEALQAIILASITKTSVRGSGHSDVIQELLIALTELGARYHSEGDVVSFYEAPQSCKAVLTCRPETAALLLPLCAAMGGEYTLLGQHENDLAYFPDKIGIECAADTNGLTIKGRIETEAIELADEKLLAGFLLVLPLVRNTMIKYEGSRARANFTLQILKGFGYSINERDGYKIWRDRNDNPAFVYNVGGDYGGAVYLMLPGFVAGEVGVTGLLSDSMQPKANVIEELKGYKLNVQELYGAVFAKKSRFRAEAVDISKSSEPCAVLMLACLGKGRTFIKNASMMQAKAKEEFELALSGLKSIGADIMQIGADTFVGGKEKLFGGTVDANESIKVSLVFAAAALRCETGVMIQNCADIGELRSLGISL